MTTNLATPTRALAVGAHPDDIEFGCGGTLAKWANDGCAVSFAVCTDGSKGSWDAFEDQSELVRTRQDEQRSAAKTLGARGDVTFFGWKDGELEAGLKERREVARVIRELAPEVILGHDPWKRYRLHPDHRNAGFLVTDGIVAARDALFFPDLAIAPHRPQTLLLWEAEAPDHVEDVSSTIELKFEALLEHRSQLLTTMSIPFGTDSTDTKVNDFQERLRRRACDDAAAEPFAFGEAFKLAIKPSHSDQAAFLTAG